MKAPRPHQGDMWIQWSSLLGSFLAGHAGHRQLPGSCYKGPTPPPRGNVDSEIVTHRFGSCRARWPPATPTLGVSLARAYHSGQVYAPQTCPLCKNYARLCFLKLVFRASVRASTDISKFTIQELPQPVRLAPHKGGRVMNSEPSMYGNLIVPPVSVTSTDLRREIDHRIVWIIVCFSQGRRVRGNDGCLRVLTDFSFCASGTPINM